MEQEFERILDKLATSTRSPRGRFSKANSWILLEKRLPHLQRRILSLHTMAGAAAVAVLCVLGWWAYYMFAPVPLQTVSTLAETRTITLPDQTEIVLNRYSSLTYPERFRGKDRKVQLQGEAYFEVSKDAAHPFKVEAGAIIVQVLGTHFNVEAYPEDTQVKTTLLEGSVSVSLIGKAEESLILSPNESAIYNKDKKSLTLHTENNASEEIIWRNGTLLFKSIPLQEIVRQLSNAFHTDIRIEDADLQNYRMTGTFSDGETLEEILSLLCRNQKFEYTKTNDIITITQKLNENEILYLFTPHHQEISPGGSGSPINLYTTKYDCICHLRSTEDQSFTNAFQHQTTKRYTGRVRETSGTKNRVQFHIWRRSTPEWTHHTGRP